MQGDLDRLHTRLTRRARARPAVTPREPKPIDVLADRSPRVLELHWGDGSTGCSGPPVGGPAASSPNAGPHVAGQPIDERGSMFRTPSKAHQTVSTHDAGRGVTCENRWPARIPSFGKDERRVRLNASRRHATLELSVPAASTGSGPMLIHRSELSRFAMKVGNAAPRGPASFCSPVSAIGWDMKRFDFPRRPKASRFSAASSQPRGPDRVPLTPAGAPG